jgi:hypothetical protein
MPKIKDLGIKVIPETMQPPGIGGGAGCGCTNFTNCIGCTQNLTVGCDPGPSCLPTPHPCDPTHGCRPTGCFETPCVPPTRCVGCTIHPQTCQPTCIETPITCFGCTIRQPHTVCHACSFLPHTCIDSPITCPGCTFQQPHTVCHGCTAHPTPCIPTPHCGCTNPVTPICGLCTNLATPICNDCTNPATPLCVVPTIGGGGCGPASPVCGGSIIGPDTIVQVAGLTQEHINALKEQLQKQIQALDEHAKTIGPKTSAEIDAREKQLNDELAQLKQRRKDLEKK